MKMWNLGKYGDLMGNILHVNIFEIVAPHLTLAKTVLKSYLSVTLELVPSALTHPLLLDSSPFGILLRILHPGPLDQSPCHGLF